MLLCISPHSQLVYKVEHNVPVDLVVLICSHGGVGTIDSGMEQAPRQAQGISMLALVALSRGQVSATLYLLSSQSHIIAILIVLCSSCTDSDGISERILNSKDNSCARIKRHEAVKCREGIHKSTGPPFSFCYCVTMKV